MTKLVFWDPLTIQGPAISMFHMPMSFYNTKCVKLLWNDFNSCNEAININEEGTDTYYGLLLFVFALSVILEIINNLRLKGI